MPEIFYTGKMTVSIAPFISARWAISHYHIIIVHYRLIVGRQIESNRIHDVVMLELSHSVVSSETLSCYIVFAEQPTVPAQYEKGGTTSSKHIN